MQYNIQGKIVRYDTFGETYLTWYAYHQMNNILFYNINLILNTSRSRKMRLPTWHPDPGVPNV